MNKRIITGILIFILLIIFSLQNTESVDLNVFSWQISGSLSLFLILSVFTGIVIGASITLGINKSHKKKQLPDLENEKEPPKTNP